MESEINSEAKCPAEDVPDARDGGTHDGIKSEKQDSLEGLKSVWRCEDGVEMEHCGGTEGVGYVRRVFLMVDGSGYGKDEMKKVK